MTRVTQSLIAKNSLANLQASLDRTGRIQERLSTGRVLNRPSDSPTGLVTAMQVRSQQARTAQYIRNAEGAAGWLDTTDSALQSSSQLLNRARDLAVQGASTGSTDGAARNALAKEVEALRDGLLQVANSSYNGRSLFAGTESATPAFNPDGTYNGNDDAVERSLAKDARIAINVTGAAAFGDDPATNAFAVLSELADALRQGAPPPIDALDVARDRVLNALGDIGARTNRVENMRALAEADAFNLEKSLSAAESIDLPETIMELQMQEVSYQAALSATSRVLQPSLLDFLR